MKTVRTWYTYFPECTVIGPRDPVPIGHLCRRGSVPRKCVTCKHFFEIGCLRAGDNREMRLDYDPCRVTGDTRPTEFRVTLGDEELALLIPTKCATCPLFTSGLPHPISCSEDQQIWGSYLRGLDWGDWRPE